MEKANGPKDFSSLWFVPFLALMVIGAVVPVIQSVHATDSERQVSATYSHGTLHLTLPYTMKQSGTGELIAQVLDPEDHVLGEARREVEFQKGQGQWQQAVKLQKPLTPDEVVWQRVRYRFQAAASTSPALDQTESISQIIRTPVIHILGQQSYLTGGEAAVRVIVADSQNDVIPGRGTVIIDL